jgi:hypothetical protein
MKGCFARIAGIWRPPVFADAMNGGFGGLHCSSITAGECRFRAVCVDQAPAKVRIDVPFLRQVRFATKAIKTLQRRERLLF